MEILNNLDANIKKLFKNNGKNTAKVILVFGCFGIMLIFLSEIIPTEEKQEKAESCFQNFENPETEEKLELRLEKEISKIKGAGKTSVMLTMDSSKEYNYAINSSEERNSSQTERKNEIVIIEGENREGPLVYKINEAKIRGVLVVCEGGDNASVREKIIEALCALLDIPSNRVSVAKMA